MSHTQCFKLSDNFRRNKKKSDDYLKSRADGKVVKKTELIPEHGIQESTLASEDFKLPKIPIKQNSVSAPPIQMSMAEIIESTEIKIVEDEDDIEIEISDTHESDSKELSVENVIKCNSLFAGEQKVSIASLFKLAIPKIDGNTVIITFTKQQESFIGDIKIQWQSYIRQYFKDKKLTLQIDIDETIETVKKAYTPEEQFMEELESNELFKKFVNRFKLKVKK